MNTIQDLYFSKKDKKGKGLFNPEDAENKLAGSKLKIKDTNTGKDISISDAYKTAGDAYNNYKKAAKNFKKASEGYGAPTHQFKNVEQEKAWTDGENIRKKWGTGLLGKAIAEINGRVKYGQSYHTADKDVQTKRQEHRDIAQKNYEAMKDGMKQQNKFRKSLYSTREKEIKDIREKVQAKSNASTNKTKRCHTCGSLIPASATQCPYCTATVKSKKPKSQGTQGQATGQAQSQATPIPQPSNSNAKPNPRPIPVPRPSNSNNKPSPQPTPSQQNQNQNPNPKPQNGNGGNTSNNNGNNGRNTGLGPRGPKGSNRSQLPAGMDLNKELKDIIALARSSDPKENKKAKLKFHSIISKYQFPDNDYKRWRNIQNYYHFSEENFSLPLTNLDEAIKKYKEVSAKHKGIYKPSNETKEERRRRMELAIEKSRVGKPIIVDGIRYYAHSEEQNRQDENDK